MTLNMLFEALAEGRLSTGREVPRLPEGPAHERLQDVPRRDGDRVSVENLIQRRHRPLGNDACVVVAEGLAGSEEEFARRMTETRARAGDGRLDLRQLHRLAA